VHSTQWRARTGVSRASAHSHRVRMRWQTAQLVPAHVNARTNDTETKGVQCTHILMAIAGALVPDAHTPDNARDCVLDKSSR
jgi:hypothetical protein